MAQEYWIGVYTQVLRPVKESAEGTKFNIKIVTKIDLVSEWINYTASDISDQNSEYDLRNKHDMIGYVLYQNKIPQHIDYDKIHLAFNELSAGSIIYGTNTDFYVCMKYQDIISQIETLLDQPAHISCEYLRGNKISTRTGIHY